jgi:hypothetical protein
MNEFDTSSLPYPGKGSTISEIIGWFNEEIKAPLATIAKANKNFVCYDIVGVLWTLYDSSCEHLERLQSIMALCDASILEDLSLELSKLTCRIVQKWWAEHDLHDVANHLCRELEVSISSALVFCFLTSI